jgi:hypothetical protein
MERASRDEVARTVATAPGRLRRGTAAGVLALLGASALTPIAAAALGGGAVVTAIAGLAGGVGSGYLTGLIQGVADQLRAGSARPPSPDTIRDALAADLLRALEKGDAAAGELAAGLAALLDRVDGFEAALAAARGDLRAHLSSCFTEVVDQQRSALRALGEVGAEQRRQGRHQRRQTALLEEIADRLRRLDRSAGSPSTAAPAATPPPSSPATAASGGPAAIGSPAARPIVAVASGPAAPGHAADWAGGTDVLVGDRTYLLYDGLLDEETSADHALVRRQAQGRRIVPAGPARDQYAWLRQAEVVRSSPAADSARAALAREHDLLRTLGTAAGLPRIATFADGRTPAGGTTSTLVLEWPASRATGVACETLGVLLGDGAPLDAWRLSRLCGGLAGLCQALARLHGHEVAHRSLTPGGIIMLDDGRLVLRDLGLAGRDPEPGEGPADYQAPEQRRRGHGRPGAATDVYQLGAVAYHLVTGHPPHPAMPPPVRAQAPGVPERACAALDAALSAEATDRPPIRRLGAALRAARDDLSKGA